MSTYRVAPGRNLSHRGRLYQAGASVDLDDAAATPLLDRGVLESADPSGDNASGEAGPPSEREPKAAFVDYVVGVLGVDRAEAEGMSKADLVELARK